MNAFAYQPSRNSLGVSVVICGPTLVNTHQALQSDFDGTICFHSEPHGAIEAAETLVPSVLLLEEEALPTLDLNALRIRLALQRLLRLVISISKLPEQETILLLRSGISGLIDRSAPVQLVEKAIRRVCCGEIWAPRKIVSEALRSAVSVITDPRFTRREMEILRRIAAGEDNRHIADSLYITRETVRWHLRSAYAKLGIHNRKIAADAIRSCQ